MPKYIGGRDQVDPPAIPKKLSNPLVIDSIDRKNKEISQGIRENVNNSHEGQVINQSNSSIKAIAHFRRRRDQPQQQ